MTYQKESWLHNCGNDIEYLTNGICTKIIRLNNNKSCKVTIARKKIYNFTSMSNEQLMIVNYDDEQNSAQISFQNQLNFEIDIQNAELIFKAKSDHDGDYHLQMDN